MDEPRNPFILGHRIPRHYFCDRVAEQKSLTQAVVNGRNVVLISPRRMGKTSLVYAALHDSDEISDEFYTFFIDILQTNSLREFIYLLGKSVFETLLRKQKPRSREFLAALKSLTGSFGFDPVSGTPTFNIQLGDIKYPEYTLEEIFRYIEECGKPVIIVIDEFQQVTKYPEKNTEAILRSHIQRLSRVSFVFAGSERSILQEMFVSSKSPFYNSSEIMHLGPISEDIYVEFAQKLFAERDRSIEESSIRWTFDIFAGNTFYTQRTMNGAFADTPAGAVCGQATVEHTVRSMLAANSVIYREILSNVSIEQKSVLYAIASEKIVSSPTGSEFVKKYRLNSASSVQSALKKLIKVGLLVKTEEGIVLMDPLLRIFINELYSTPEF